MRALIHSAVNQFAFQVFMLIRCILGLQKSSKKRPQPKTPGKGSGSSKKSRAGGGSGGGSGGAAADDNNDDPDSKPYHCERKRALLLAPLSVTLLGCRDRQRAVCALKKNLFRFLLPLL